MLTLLVGAPLALADWDPCDPHKMHFPQMPDPTGWDVSFWLNFMGMIPLQGELADDWQCSETGPVEDIHFWISWQYGQQGTLGPATVSIYSNDPCGPYGYSEPNELLWQQTFQGLDAVYYGDGDQGWYDPFWMHNLHDHSEYYQVNITDIQEPFIQQEDEIYWLAIRLTPPGVGWKTSLDHFMDNAVYTYITPDPCVLPPADGWGELNDPCTGGPLSFAFVITGEPEEPPPGIKWQQLPDPNMTGYHCHDGIHMADDWLCEGGLVTDLHWWGTNETHDNEWGFDISIFADACSLPDGPAGPLWTVTAPIGPGPGEVRRTDSGLWHPFYTIWYYEYDLLVPFPQVAGEIYWLDLTAIDADPCDQSGWHWQGNSDPIILSPPVCWYPPAPADPCNYVDFNLAFEITSGPKPPVPDLKWSQPPIEYDPTEPEPRFCGWDEVSFTNDPCEWWRIAADDFRCFGSMPIDSIHWWGSYWYWDGDEPPDVAGIEPPVIGWRLGFWTNEPAHPNNPWSHPEMLLWQIEVPAARVPVERVGVDEHPMLEGFLETCFQYYVDLEPDEVFWQEEFLEDTQDDVFWLSIAAVYDPCDTYIDYPWGWKTRPWSWMDDGVVFELIENPEEGMVIDPCSNPMYPIEYQGESYDLAFELDTDPNWIKWDQPFTGIRHWPHYEDVASWMEWWPEGIAHLTVAADDWQCQGPLPVTALGWWGSYLGYQYQPCSIEPDPPKQVMAPPEQPAYFDVSIWTDVPAGADPHPDITWSHPDQMVWQYDVYDYDEVLVGYDKYPHDPCGPMPGPHEPVFRYTARIPEEEWFWQDPNDSVYWLSIVAVYEEHYPQYVWGWTNHQHVYNDDAVQTPEMVDPDPAIPWQWYEIYDQTGASADLSFTIYTDPYAELEIDFGDAPDPCYPTLLANDGARHIIGGPWLGPADDAPDPEGDGQPDPLALGDDNDGNDDEDGVTIPTLTQGIPDNITIEVSGGGGAVEIWIDWNGDGDWNDPGELLPSASYGDGIHLVPVTAPIGSVIGQTFSRCRISTNGGLAPTGLAVDGEVEDHELYIEPGLDFGDAPDPCYPTLLASNGARHTIVPGFCLGVSIDAELNGQPDATATGDDSDGNDDEDGVVFTTPLIPGQPASVNVTASVAGQLNAWIDYWGNGDWADPVDQVFLNQPLAAGLNVLGFIVPPSAAGNIDTFARFRFSTAGGLSYTGQADDGEVEDYEVHIEQQVKWSQPPVEIDPGPPPIYYGWDEYSIYGGMQIAGDDWLCEDQRPVSDVHWWGSYYEWLEPVVPPVPTPIGFHIGIWTDVPLGDPCNMYPYSHPGRMIWEYWADMAEVNEEWVGFDFHEQHPMIDACFRYDLQLPEEFWFWQEGPGNIYWLTISAMYMEPPPPVFYWGWKTRPYFFNDDAIRIYWPTAPMVGEPYIEGEPILPGWDMAFELTTPCSNCGDFDHNGSIELNDLRILAANWLWTGTPGGYNIGDLNCDGKIDYEDFAIFALQWLGSCP